MKKYFILAVAAIAVLSGCKKDNNGEAGSFTATIEQSSAKTTLDGNNNNEVYWKENGEQIIINGVVFTGTRDATNYTCATFTNNSASHCYPIDDYYKAYYPTSLYQDGTYKLPAEQTYDAATNGISNLPMYAQCSSDQTNLVFHNLCAVLEITVNSSDVSSVDSIVVKSDKQMNGAFTADASGVLTFCAGTLTAANKKVKLVANSPVTINANESKIFRIAIPENEAHNLIIRVYNGATCRVMATKNVSGLNIVRNHIYPITFVENAVQLWAGSPCFATFNLGATSPEQYGDYYAWGATAPSTNNNYSQSVAPFYSNSSYTMYNSYDNKTTLDSEYDAATQTWGSNWRMPTYSDFDNLLNTANATQQMGNISGGAVYGCTFTGNGDYLSHSIFLPAAGHRYSNNNDNTLRSAGEKGCYWSRSLDTDDRAKARYLHFESSSRERRSYVRYNGFSVRPVLSE